MYRARRPQVKFPAFATLSIPRPPMPMYAFFRGLLRDEEGPTAVEYAVLVGAIGLAVAAAVAAFQTPLVTAFTSIITKAGL